MPQADLNYIAPLFNSDKRSVVCQQVADAVKESGLIDDTKTDVLAEVDEKLEDYDTSTEVDGKLAALPVGTKLYLHRITQSISAGQSTQYMRIINNIPTACSSSSDVWSMFRNQPFVARYIEEGNDTYPIAYFGQLSPSCDVVYATYDYSTSALVAKKVVGISQTYGTVTDTVTEL